MDLSSSLIEWYKLEQRDLPWRKTRDPYAIWLSEIILQQTRVDQGLAYYLKFIEHYPTVQDLANASEQDVLNDWQGLGYYSRARNLHATAKFVAQELEGNFPQTAKELEKLKGVGRYTAAAIASFCFGEVAPLVDGNVYRVLSRIYGLDDPIDKPAGQRVFWDLAQQLISKQDPASHNQAIMEFGAVVCTPKAPRCETCVFSTACMAKTEDRIKDLPVKAGKIKRRTRYFDYWVIQDKHGILMKKRPAGDIWTGLYDFPLIETTVQQDTALFHNALSNMKEFVLNHAEIKAISPVHKHVLSHQDIFARFITVEADIESYSTPIEHIKTTELDTVPIPRLIDKFLIKSINP